MCVSHAAPPHRTHRMTLPSPPPASQMQKLRLRANRCDHHHAALCPGAAQPGAGLSHWWARPHASLASPAPSTSSPAPFHRPSLPQCPWVTPQMEEAGWTQLCTASPVSMGWRRLQVEQQPGSRLPPTTPPVRSFPSLHLTRLICKMGP